MVSRSKFVNEITIIMYMYLYISNRDALVRSSAGVKYNTIFVNYCIWENAV